MSWSDMEGSPRQRIRAARSSGDATLDLEGLGLAALPAELGQLIDLQALYLRNNRLTGLPTWIGQLSNLHALDLLGNRLHGLPPELGQLTNCYRQGCMEIVWHECVGIVWQRSMCMRRGVTA